MKCLKFGLSWGNNDFVTQFTHVFRQFGVNCRKQKQNFLGKTVLKIWSQIYPKKTAYVSTKLLLEKNAKTKKN